jgi:hypothetical protein
MPVAHLLPREVQAGLVAVVAPAPELDVLDGGFAAHAEGPHVVELPRVEPPMVSWYL